MRDLPGMGFTGRGLVPAGGLRELARTIGAAKVTAGLLDREAVFSSDRGSLRIRLIEGAFPKYRSLLPDTYPNQVIMEKEAVLEALGRVALVAEDHIPVRLKIGEGGVEVNVTRQDVGAEVEHLPGEFSPAQTRSSIAFNPRYLADGVAAIAGDKIRMRLIDGLKPSVLDNGDGGFRSDAGDSLYLLDARPGLRCSVRLAWIALADFRSYADLRLEPRSRDQHPCRQQRGR